MKCAMKKNNLFLSIATTVMLALTTACVEYPDVYGFAAAFGSSNETTVVEYTPTQYTIQLKSSTTIFDEGAGISEYGFHVKVQDGYFKPLEDIKVTPTQGTDGNITLTATFQGEYGKRYSFCPYATDGQQTQEGTPSEFQYTQNNFSLGQGSSKLSFDENGQIVAVAYYARTSGHPITEATASYGGLDLPTTISTNGSTVTAVLDLSRLEKGKSYTSIQFEAKNDMGVCKSSVTFSVTVPNTSTASYPDDGEKEDCIRLCGIDWAKGNLANNGNKYYIEENQWEAGSNYKIREGTSLNTDWAEKITGWATPSSTQARLLLKASRFPCYVVCADSTNVYGYLYISPKEKQIQATTAVNIPYSLVDEMGLFIIKNNDYLLSNGYLSYNSTNYKVYEKYIFCFTEINEITNYSIDYGKYYYHNDKKDFSIRPVKNE